MDRAGIPAVVDERELLQAERRDDVVAVDRLCGIVKDVQDVLSRLEEQLVERQQPVGSEVLAFVDNDRVVSRPELRDRLVERRGQRPVPPALRDRIWFRWENVRFAAEVLAQLVERRDVEVAGRRGDVGGFGREEPSKRLVEADKEGSKALLRESTRLLRRQQRLARPGSTDDLGP